MVGLAIVLVAAAFDVLMLAVSRGARGRIAVLLILTAASAVTAFYALDASFDLCFELPT